MHDTIVIGSDLSSLIAALISASSGKKTVLLSENPCEDAYIASGYTFNVDSCPWVGFGTDQVLFHLLGELNLPMPDQEVISLLNPSLQVILPDHRVDLWMERERLIIEMEREFPSCSHQIQRLYSSISNCDTLCQNLLPGKRKMDRGILQKYKDQLTNNTAALLGAFLLNNRLSAFGKSSPIRRIFDAQLFVLSNLVHEFIKQISSAHQLSLPWKGVYYPVGGKKKFIDILKKNILSLSGEIFSPCRISRMEIGPKIQIEIEGHGATTNLHSNYLVISEKWLRLRSSAHDNIHLARYLRDLRSIDKIYYPFTLHMGISDRGLPEKLNEYVIIVCDHTKSFDDGNLIHLEISAFGDEERAPKGKRAVSATVFLSELPINMEDAVLERIALSILDNLHGFFPFLKENIDFIDVKYSIYLSRQCQEIVSPKYMLKRPSLLDFIIKSKKPFHEKVFVTGGFSMAGLGFEGEVYSGIQAGHLTTGGISL
jgi:phytoene dehydrogenase-like protein